MAVAIVGQTKLRASAFARYKALDAVSDFIERITVRLPAIGAAAVRHRTVSKPCALAASGAVGLELTAMRNYADFMAKHPNMPLDHRARLLARIMRGCEELQRNLM